MNFYVVVFVLLLVGLFLLLGISLRQLIPKHEKKISVAGELFTEKRQRLLKPKYNRLERHKNNVEMAIRAGESKITFAKYLQAVVIFSILGFLLGLLFGNLLLSLSMAICLPCIPYQYLKMRSAGHKKQLISQMESAVSIITNTYLQCDDIRHAVRASLPNIDQPLKSILIELDTALLFGTNTIEALLHVRSRIESSTWREWIDRLIQCQENRSMKNLLPPIIADITDIRQIQEELDTKMADIWREHIVISVIVLGSIPLMRLLNAQWYNYLANTLLGQLVVALTFVVTFLATFYVIRVNQPISAEV